MTSGVDQIAAEKPPADGRWKRLAVRPIGAFRVFVQTAFGGGAWLVFATGQAARPTLTVESAAPPADADRHAVVVGKPVGRTVTPPPRWS